MQLKHTKKAFTLIELIMVVVLIGVIAIFAIPGYTKSVAKAYEKAASNNLMIMYSAQKLRYNSGSNNYLPTATGGTLNLAGINTAGSTGLGLGIIANNVTYECTNGISPSADNQSFYCTGAYGTSFTVRVSNTSSVVCCSAGTCPSAPGC